ncbi:CD151 antigen [Liparis tanakae]|uniref:CD151 antigen n=1 Tax=Liparis tanakae TaxID=230148 RepID=A0A4Z2JAB8_9TELE|nr:CD151 antigen [Liparis tanakae]
MLSVVPLPESQRTLVSPQRVFKVVFLGNSGAGKSSFIQQYCSGHFYSKVNATVAIDFKMKTLTLGSTVITLQLWDTAGQERFRSVTEQYYRQADGILAMYDITHASSFTAVRAWLDSVKEKMGDRVVLMLLANKLDLAGDRRREVKTREGQRLADLAGGVVLAVGVWTLVEKSDYISLLNSSFYSVSAYILIAAGVIVIVTGIIGCCATLKEKKSLLIVYLVLLLGIFLLEVIAGVLAYITYQECFPFCYQLDEEMRQNLKVTMQQKYQQPGEESITQAVDKLQQEVWKCY